MNIEGIFSDETNEYVSIQSLKNRQNIRTEKTKTTKISKKTDKPSRNRNKE